MSENEPLINFNCACGKPVQTPASLCGQKLHCPYEGCEAIIEAPPAADAAPAAPESGSAGASSGPRKPRMPPPKGFKGGKGKDLPAPAKKPRPPAPSAAATPAKDGDKPAATPASETAPAAESAAPPKKKNKLFFAACSGITLIAAVVILQGKDKKTAPAAPAATAVAPAATKPAPAAPAAPMPKNDPAPPVEGGGRKPRQQVDADALNARLAEKLAEQKKAAAGARKNLVTAAEAGGSDEWIALASDLLQHDSEENRAEARKWLEKAAARKTSRAFLLLGELETDHGSREKAVTYYVQGAASIASAKSEARDAKLETFAVRLDRLEAADEAAKIRARIAGDAKSEAKPSAPATEAKPAKPTPPPAPKAAPAAEAKPAPVEEVPGIPEPPAPAVPAPAEEVPGIPEPLAAPAVPAPAEEVPGIPEPPVPNGL